MQEVTKACSQCKESKLVSEFYKKNGCKLGVASICKSCSSLSKRDYYIKNKEKLLSYTIDYHIKNKEKVLRNKRAYRNKNKETILSKKRIHKNRQVEILDDQYILQLLRKRTKLDRSILANIPKLISAYKKQIEIKRLLKDK